MVLVANINYFSNFVKKLNITDIYKQNYDLD
jgi:hypothetical protein